MLARSFVVAAGVWLLVDLERVWTPSLITIFGQAAETPPELIGLFALTPFLLAVVAARLLAGQSVALPAALGLLLLTRMVVQFSGGDQLQLWAATVGVVAGAVWLCLAVGELSESLVPGLFAGIALATVSHVALGTYGAVWREDLWGYALLVAQLALGVLALVVAGPQEEPQPRPPGVPAGLALAVFPALLLAGITLANPARASVSALWWGPAVVAVATVLAAAIAAHGPPARLPALTAATLLVAATGLTMLASGPWLLAGYAVGLPSLAACLGSLSTRRPSRRPELPAAAGGVAWVLLLFGFYAGYDLGYRADWLVVALATAVATAVVIAVVTQSATNPPSPRVRPRTVVLTAAAGLLAGAAAAAPLATIAPLSPHPESGEPGSVRVMAFNVRMGYGGSGRFDPLGIAGLIHSSGADVVLLSEVDRAWLLNGGQDLLAILARRLDMDFAFGAAADQVWGDAILARETISDVEHVTLEPHGSLTGAQALSARVGTGCDRLRVIATHLQPTDNELDRTEGQASEVADLIRAHPDEQVVAGGDLNTTPGSAAWNRLTQVATDALAASRPLPTSPADQPENEIDHLFTTGGLDPAGGRSYDSALSDHLPVSVDVVPSCT